MHIWAIIAAGGSGSRLAGAGGGTPKQFMEYRGVPLYWHGARAFARVAALRGVVFVFPPHLLDDAAQDLERLARTEDFPLPFKVAAGGKERQDSVRNALTALPPECDAVLVHDAARPFVTPRLAASVAQALLDGHAGVIPGLPVVDTVKQVDATGTVTATIDRATLRAVQTPQGFFRPALVRAHETAVERGLAVTDDAALLEAAGIPVLVVPGDAANVKITSPADLALLHPEHTETPMPVPLTGFGYDVHAFGGGRPLILGGVPIPCDLTVNAHSDGDTLLHALIDAILGCLGRGDIGTLFPDSDPGFAGIESGILLAEVLRLAAQDRVTLAHADLTVVAQTPRLAPHRERIAANVARLLGLPLHRVNVKATTEEKLGFTGEKKGIKAYAVVTAMQAE